MWGTRPGPVVDPRPQERVLQLTVEPADAICPFVQILDALVPQMGEQLVHFFKFLDTQVIDVPKIAEDTTGRAWSTVICDMRRSWNSWWKCRLSCLLPRSSSRLPSISLTLQFRVVMGAQVVEVFMVFSQNIIQQRLFPGRSLTFQLEDVKVVAQDRFQPRQPHCLALQMRQFKSLFQNCSQISKKRAVCREGSSAGVATHTSSWTPAASESGESLSEEEEEDPDVWIDEHGRTWWRSCAVPRRWFLLGTGMDVDIFWDEPVGFLESDTGCGCFFMVS